MHTLCHTAAHIRCGALRISESNRNEYEREQVRIGRQMMPMLKSRKDYLEIECDTCCKLHTGVVFYIQNEAESSAPHHSDGVNSGQTYLRSGRREA